MTVSVALCTYNGELYISNQLNSILNQSYPVNEIIICDDASTDATIQILEDYRSNFSGIITIYKNSINIGTLRNFENAILNTHGEIIFLSDQDDIWDENKVEKTIELFKSDPDALLVFSDGDLIDENGKYLGNSLWGKWDFNTEMQKRWKDNTLAFSDLLKNTNRVTGATVAFDSKLKRLIIPIIAPKDYWHDAWIALHAAGLNGLRYTDEFLIRYRIHPDQQIGLPTSMLIKKNQNNFSSSISDEKFNEIIKSKFPKLFRSRQPIIKKLKSIFKSFILKIRY